MKLTKGKGQGSTNCGAPDMPRYAKRATSTVDKFNSAQIGNQASPPTTNTSRPYQSKAGATSSPANTIRKGLKSNLSASPKGHTNRG